MNYLQIKHKNFTLYYVKLVYYGFCSVKKVDRNFVDYFDNSLSRVLTFFYGLFRSYVSTKFKFRCEKSENNDC